MKYIIGFDGGGTKTRCVLGTTDGTICADYVGGPSNHQTVGIKNTQIVIRDLYNKVMKQASCRPIDIEFVFLGLAGADMPSDFNLLNTMCKDVFDEVAFEVVNDAWLIMRSGTKNLYGAVSIYGTGANAAAVNTNGEMNILRALDYHLGGGGGGGEISYDALHYAFRATEKTYLDTKLRTELPKLLNMSSMDELLGHMYPENKIPYSELNKIPPLVFDLARNGDQVSKELLAMKGKLQGQMLNGVLRQSNMIGKSFPVVIGGSIYNGNADDFMDAFTDEVLKYSPEALFIKPTLAPVTGAYLLGLDRVNISLNKDKYYALKTHLSL